MIAIDTNVLVRLITNDDPAQAERVKKAIAKQKLFISKTVLLETEWVLRYCYKLKDNDILTIFSIIYRLENTIFEQHTIIGKALVWYKAGLDFADALHLAACDNVKKFLTFDKALIKKAQNLTNFPVASE